MEMYARVAHKYLWHDFKPGWELHKSHHEPRHGPFEVRIFMNIVVTVHLVTEELTMGCDSKLVWTGK